MEEPNEYQRLIGAIRNLPAETEEAKVLAAAAIANLQYADRQNRAASEHYLHDEGYLDWPSDAGL